jgi:hypothetical protein
MDAEKWKLAIGTNEAVWAVILAIIIIVFIIANW